MSRLSVIIPTFNRAVLLGHTLGNLLEQSRPPDEIIVVDDGSTDDTELLVRSLSSSIKFIRQSNQGPGAARNAGLRVATGDFVQFQDDDDLFSLNKLEVQEQLLIHSGADIAFGPWVKGWFEGETFRLEDKVLQQRMPPSHVPLTDWWMRGWSTVFQSLLFRRSFLKKVGFYRTDIRFGEDGEYFFRALLARPKIAYSPEGLTLYRLHEGAKLTRGEAKVLDWLKCLRSTADYRRWLPVGDAALFLYLAELRRQTRYLGEQASIPVDLYRLDSQVNQVPALWLDAVDLWMRGTEKLRFLITGSRWRPSYRAGDLTPAQAGLIKELGFTPE